MTSPALTPEQETIYSVLSIAWEPKSVRWVSNGCSFGMKDCERILNELTQKGAVTRLKRHGIDELGLDYVYDAYIYPDRVKPYH